MVIEFGSFRVDFHAQILTRNEKPIALRRKTWDVLRYLCERPGKMVGREELAEAVWGGVVVSDDVVTAAVRELRRALGDTPTSVIETIRGRGFRFVAPLASEASEVTGGDESETSAPNSLAGRADALQQLNETWTTAKRRPQRVVFISGSAGIGKTALVESFLREVGASDSRRYAVGRGECGDGDFHPILQALEHLCRSPRGEDVVAALRRYAPEWIARLNVRLKPADRAVVPTSSPEASEERLIAGLLDAFACVAQDFPLVLALEDLHRCDARTRTFLRRFTQRYDSARILVVGTYRTDASDAHAGAMLDAWKDLIARGKAREIPLAPLDREGVAVYLAGSYPGLESARFVDWAYRQSRGNPAVLRRALDELATRGAVRRVDGVWRIADPAKIGTDYVSYTAPSSIGAISRFFVGRSTERARLARAWSLAQSGRRRTVIVTGEPGIGKSAMVRSFLEDLGSAPDRHIMVGKCTEQRSRAEAYMPLLDMFESWRCDDSSGEVAEQLLRLAPHWARQMPGIESEIFPASMLVAIDAQPERMMREAAAWIEAMAQTRSLVVVLEDAHWSDPATIDLLSYLATRTSRAQLLIIVTYRPVEAASQPDLLSLDLASRDDIERIDLEPLSPPEIRAWLDSTFDHTADVVDHLADEAIRRSSGNPLFLQAVTRSLTSAGCAVETAEGWKVGPPKFPLADVPLELGGLIASQLRLLPDDVREILSVASVVGEEFDGATVAAAIGRPLETVDAVLSSEARRSFVISAAGASVWPDGTVGGRYRFRHALYQRSLYDGLPPHERARTHRAVAAAIEHGFTTRLAMVTTELAEHYSAGGDHSAAANHLERSALLMIERSALRQAIAYFERAIDALACLPDSADRDACALRSHTGCGLSVALLEGPQSERVQHHIRMTSALLPKVEDLTVIFPSLRVLWFRDLFTWNLAAMTQRADELVRRSASGPNSTYRALALSVRGATACYQGEVEVARRDLEESMRLCDDPHLLPSPGEWVIDARVETRCYLAWMLWLNGFPDRSRALLLESLRLAEDGAHESTRCMTLWFAASMSQLRREEIAYDYAELMDSYSGHVGFVVWRQFAAILGAVAQLERGDESALDAILTALLQSGDQPSAMIARAYLLGQLAMAYGRKGDPLHGIALIEVALARISDNGLRVSESELLRIRGDLQQIAGDTASADSSYVAALTVARRQGSRAFELRAATGRARLHRDTDSGPAMLSELQQIYESFGDGFDSPDVIEARALLTASPPL